MDIVKGWEIAEDRSESSSIVSLTALVTTEALSILIPSGARLYLESISGRVVDAGSDQVSFLTRLNGQPIIRGLDSIQAVLFDYTNDFSVKQDIGPGLLVISGKNDSAGPIRVVVSVKCFLLRSTYAKNQLSTYMRY